MKLAFAYHPGLVYQPMDAEHLFDAPRGLTGSEISCLMYAVAMAERGHEVAWFGPVAAPASVRGVRVAPYRDDAFGTGWDAVLAWNRNDALTSACGLRVLNMQMSEVGLCRPNWEATADFLCPLSRTAAGFLRGQTALPDEKWRIMPNGHDPEAFRPGVKVPGRVVWASSHDRGLHRVLELWPALRERVPHAELQVLYDDGGMKRHANIDQPGHPWQELHRRAHYIMRAVERLAPHGVRMVGAVSREQVAREFAAAEVLAYPCEPVSATETFGVTVLEAMASGCVPVLTDADCFGELWGGHCPMAKMPYDRAAYEALLVGVMTDQAERERWAERGRRRAAEFTWRALAERLERFVETGGAEGFERAWP